MSILKSQMAQYLMTLLVVHDADVSVADVWGTFVIWEV